MNSIGLYLHIPYCLHKCGYCDFNSHNINEAEMETYVRALLDEMEQAAKDAQNYQVSTIFFGGGTPTTLPFADLARTGTARMKISRVTTALATHHRQMALMTKSSR